MITPVFSLLKQEKKKTSPAVSSPLSLFSFSSVDFFFPCAVALIFSSLHICLFVCLFVYLFLWGVDSFFENE